MLIASPSYHARILAISGFLAATSLICPAAHPAEPMHPASNSPAKTAQLSENYGKLPLSFEANQGQSDPQVKFLSRGNGYSLFLTNRAAVLSLTKTRHTGQSSPEGAGGFNPRKPAAEVRGASAPEAKPTQSDTIEMQLANANPTAQVSGADQLPGAANYFLGNDPAKWRANVPTYAKVRYTNIYDGIDLVYYGNQRQLEYDFIVQPGHNPKAIQLHFAGAQQLKLTPTGDLEVIAKNGQIAFHKPVLYQDNEGRRQPVEGQFTLQANNNVAFQIGNYDQTRALVIDPVLAYSTYLGSTGTTAASAISVDSDGFAYITGNVYLNDFPLTSAPFQSTNKEQPSLYPTGFVTKLSQNGTSLVYSTYIGGSGGPYGDQPTAIAVDSSGSVYVTGTTGAADFPITSGAFQAKNPGLANKQTSPFVTKFSTDGSSLEYSTYLGGSGELQGQSDIASGIAVDAEGNAYIAGTAYSTDFPVKSPYQSTNVAQPNQNGPGSNAFVTKLNPTGTALVWSTYLGGSGNSNCNEDGATGIAVDSSDSAYVTGGACSANFPIAGSPFQSKYVATTNLTSEAFVTKFAPAGNQLKYSTYLGGSGISPNDVTADPGDAGLSIAIDASGDAYVTGYTYSTDFPVLNPYQTTNHAASNQGSNAFITELKPDGSGLEYSTYLGGSVAEIGVAIAVDSEGDAYVFGDTSSPNFPITSGTAFQTSNPATPFGTTFLTELNPAESAAKSVLYSTYFGGYGTVYGDFAWGVALDSDGGIYLAGSTFAQAFPTTVGAFQTINRGYSGNESAFVSKLYSGTAAALNRATISQLTASPTSQAYGKAVTFTAAVRPATGTGTPTGTVAFSFLGGPPTVVALDSTGHASYSTITLLPTPAPFRDVVTAVYSGDATFQGSGAGAGVQITGSDPSTYITGANTGSQQSSPVGKPFGNPLQVGVFTYALQPASGVTVTFSGAGLTFSPTSVKTNSEGLASVIATPTTTGNLIATATVVGQQSPAYFHLIGVPSGALPDAATPAFSPGQGTYSPSVKVTITDAIAAATIYYTTNGATPTAASTKYTGPITVSTTETLEAIAVATGYTNSAVATAKYTIEPTTATPAISLATGTYPAKQTVTITDTTTGAAIYYTTNGTTPTTASTKYTGPITVSTTETLEAIAVATGYTNSSVATAKYTIETPTATPVFTPPAGTYTVKQTVTVTDATPGAVIYFTTNGITPTSASAKYTASITVSATETLEAIAVAPGYTSSAPAIAKYVIETPAATPVFSAKSGTYESVQALTLTSVTPGAVIYYTTNGATPTTASTKYTAPISISTDETITAIAIAAGYTDSAAASATYTLVGSPSALSAPATAISNTGAALNAVVDTLGLAGSYYFQYGTSSTALTTTTAKTTLSAGTIPVDASAKLTTLAAKTTYYYQAVVTTAGGASSGAILSFTTGATTAATPEVKAVPIGSPTFSPAAGTYATAQTVKLTSKTVGAVICYSTNGVPPNSASCTRYTGPITVGKSETIDAIAVASGHVSATSSAKYTIE